MNNNEFNYIKYLFSYKRGVVISEQKNIVSEQTVDEINPKGLKLNDTGPDVVELQQKLIDMDRLIATKDWKSKKKGEKWTEPTGTFGVDTADALAKLEAEQNKPIEKQEPKLATIEQYPCLTDDNKLKWRKSIFYADGKVLLHGDYGKLNQFSCGEDGDILVNGLKLSNSLPKFTKAVEKGMSSEFIDENKKYQLDKNPVGEDQVSSPISISTNDSGTNYVFKTYIMMDENPNTPINISSDGTANLMDENGSVVETGTFDYDGTNLTFSWDKTDVEIKDEGKSEWYYYDATKKAIGPLTISQLKEKINPDTYVWRDGMQDATLAKNVKSLKLPKRPPSMEPKTKARDRSNLQGTIGTPISTSPKQQTQSSTNTKRKKPGTIKRPATIEKPGQEQSPEFGPVPDL